MDTAGERAATTELTRSECQYQNYQTPKVCWSVCLNNVSQLAGFAKKEDLRYFARAIGNIEYVHARELTPTQEMPDAYKKRKGGWDLYQQDFLELMRARGIEGSAQRCRGRQVFTVQRGKTTAVSSPTGGRVPSGSVARRRY